MTSENSNLSLNDILQRAQRIRLLLMDCDGVLTDGRLWLTADGDEQKAFHARDGQGIKLLHAAGIDTGIISGRTSGAVDRRAHELEMTFVRQGVHDKIAVLSECLKAASVSEQQCAYIGDDIADVPVMQRVGFAIAVADAVDETKQAAHYVTRLRGGNGAVREVTDLILNAIREISR